MGLVSGTRIGRMRAQAEDDQQHDRAHDPRRPHAEALYRHRAGAASAAVRHGCTKSDHEKAVPVHERPALSLTVSDPVPVPSRPAVGMSALAVNATPLIVAPASLPKFTRPS